MKNGRKAAALLAVVLTLLSFCSFTAAGQKAYSLEEAGVSLSLPADLRVLRYPVEEGNPLIPLTGWSAADELNSYYEETGTLLEAYFPDTGACLSVESWSDGESMAIGSFTSQSEAQLLERIADYPFAWQYGEEGQSTASLENRGEQPYLLYTNESEEGILSRYYETVAGGNWFYLSLYGPANGRPLLEEELSALEDALDTLSFLQAQEGAASTSGLVGGNRIAGPLRRGTPALPCAGALPRALRAPQPSRTAGPARLPLPRFHARRLRRSLPRLFRRLPLRTIAPLVLVSADGRHRGDGALLLGVSAQSAAPAAAEGQLPRWQSGAPARASARNQPQGGGAGLIVCRAAAKRPPFPRHKPPAQTIRQKRSRTGAALRCSGTGPFSIQKASGGNRTKEKHGDRTPYARCALAPPRPRRYFTEKRHSASGNPSHATRRTASPGVKPARRTASARPSKAWKAPAV